MFLSFMSPCAARISRPVRSEIQGLRRSCERRSKRSSAMSAFSSFPDVRSMYPTSLGLARRGSAPGCNLRQMRGQIQPTAALEAFSDFSLQVRSISPTNVAPLTGPVGALIVPPMLRLNAKHLCRPTAFSISRFWRFLTVSAHNDAGFCLGGLVKAGRS